MLAEEMMYFIRPKQLSFSGCYFVTEPGREEAFAVPTESHRRLEVLEIKACKLNNNPLTYKALSAFVSGRYFAKPKEKPTMLSKIGGEPFWSYCDKEKNERIFLGDILKSSKQPNGMEATSDIIADAFPVLETVRFEGIDPKCGGLFTLLDCLGHMPDLKIYLKEAEINYFLAVDARKFVDFAQVNPATLEIELNNLVIPVPGNRKPTDLAGALGDYAAAREVGCLITEETVTIKGLGLVTIKAVSITGYREK